MITTGAAVESTDSRKHIRSFLFKQATIIRYILLLCLYSISCEYIIKPSFYSRILSEVSCHNFCSKHNSSWKYWYTMPMLETGKFSQNKLFIAVLVNTKSTKFTYCEMFCMYHIWMLEWSKAGINFVNYLASYLISFLSLCVVVLIIPHSCLNAILFF